MSNKYIDCSGLKSVVIGDGLKNIEEWTFCRCTSLAKVFIGDSVANIGEDAFINCSNLVSLTIGSNVTSIEDNAFCECSSLSSLLIPNSVTSIGNHAFFATNLDTLMIGNGVTSIGGEAFYCGNSYSYVQVGNSYTMNNILYYAKTLAISEDYSDAYFPEKDYSEYEFSTIVCKMATPPTLPATFSDYQYKYLNVIVPTESLAKYHSANVWKDFLLLKGGAEDYSATGINSEKVDAKHLPTFVYDMQGRKLSMPQRGLNIINGKKVIVK